jgi:enoyl-CoA hydratase/carnithine racemase
VVDTGAGLIDATAWAKMIAERGPLATEATKMMIAVAEGEDVSGAAETLASGFIASTGDLKAGVEAFRSKQKAIFSRT